VIFYCRDCCVEQPAHVCDHCLGNCAVFATRVELYAIDPELRARDLFGQAGEALARELRELVGQIRSVKRSRRVSDRTLEKKELLTMRNAASALGINRSKTLKKVIKAGVIHPVPFMGEQRIRRSDLDQLIEKWQREGFPNLEELPQPTGAEATPPRSRRSSKKRNGAAGGDPLDSYQPKNR